MGSIIFAFISIFFAGIAVGAVIVHGIYIYDNKE